MRALVLAVACLSLAMPARSWEARGHAIFTGKASNLADARTEERLARSPCHSCHGRDALGGVEGDVPPIDRTALLRRTADRPAYDAELFARALTGGIDPVGRELNRYMPRYDFTPAEIATLWEHLARIGEEQRTGVHADRVNFGLPALPGRPELSEALAAAVRAGLDHGLGGGTVWGRKVDITVLPTGAPFGDVFALISPRAADVAAATAEGLPSLFPIGALAGDEDRSIVRAAGASREGIRASMARGLAAVAPTSVTILDAEVAGADPEREDEGEAAALAVALRLEAQDMAERIRLTLPTASTGVDAGAVLVLLSTERLDAAREWPGPVWLSWEALQALEDTPRNRGVRVAVIETPWIVSRAIETGRHPVLVHGERAGAVLAEALKVAGRDITRSGLLLALDETILADWGLDYAAHPLTGTDDVLLLGLGGD